MISLINNLSYRLTLKAFSYARSARLVKPMPLIAQKGTLHHTFYHKPILAGEDGNNLCKEYLLDDKPCMLGRIGTIEMGVLQACLDKRAGLLKEVGEYRINLICRNAGFFPNSEEAIEKFEKIYLDATKDVDVLGVFCNHMEDFFIKEYAPNAKLVQFTTYEPFYYEHPWSYALEGKKVLVIHPFVDSINYQYKRRELLFDNPEVLPKFELSTIKAVQTISNNTAGFDSWFDALDYMKGEIDKADFDIALIGCGAYAYPLASYVKRLGKKSVVTAGATQLLFGIKGARWDNAETPVPYKDTWIRPNQAETPSGSKDVENGCYW